jgi:hypothetical protein
VGGTIGSYIPVLLGSGDFSGWSILGFFFGSIAGIWAGVKLNSYF